MREKVNTHALLPNDREPAPKADRERVYVGIDIGYKEHVAAAIPLSFFNPTRHVNKWRSAKTLHFSSEMSGFRRLRQYLDKFSTQLDDFVILLEPTGGFYAITLLTYLTNAGYHVWQIDNRSVKQYREKLLGNETKTDEIDARLMARMAFLHEVVGEEFSIQPVQAADPDYAGLHVMVQDYVKLQKEITRRRNQLQQVVAVTFPELKEFFKDGTGTPSARALLQRYATPLALAQANIEEIETLFRDARAYTLIKRAGELKALATDSAGLKMMSHHQWRQGWIIQQLNTLEQARGQLLQQMGLMIVQHPYAPIIESLPVKSPIWTATLIAVIGDIRRFPNYNEFKAYMGWYPSKAQSGSSLNSSGLAHKGVRLSRRALGQMALILISPTIAPNPFAEFYARLVARGMKPSTALGHMAGKLAVVLYSMLKNMTPYDINRHRKGLGLATTELVVASTAELPSEILDTIDGEEESLEKISA